MMNQEFYLGAWGCCLLSAIYSLAPPDYGWLQATFTGLGFISILCWGATRP